MSYTNCAENTTVKKVILTSRAREYNCKEGNTYIKSPG